MTDTDKFVTLSLLYPLRKATEELKRFHSPEALEMFGVEVDGVILSKGRLLQYIEFLETAEVGRSLGPGVSGPDYMCWTDTAISATQLISMSTGTLQSTDGPRHAPGCPWRTSTSYRELSQVCNQEEEVLKRILWSIFILPVNWKKFASDKSGFPLDSSI